MDELNIWLLGSSRLETMAKPIVIERHKALALLVYLAMTGEAQSRDSLAALFWPDSDQSRARASLRRDLSILRKTIGADRFVVGRETIDLQRDDLWLDVVEFRKLVDDCHQHGHAPGDVCSACLPLLTKAANLYRGDFLTGFSLRDCPEFDEWQFFQREVLQQELAHVLTLLVQFLRAQEAYEAAIPHARRWVGLDPLNEPAQQQLIQLYALAGQQSAAMRQSRIFTEILQNELGVTPSPPTAMLIEKVKKGQEARSIESENEGPPHNLPVPATGFVGRVAEVTDLEQRLNDPGCRLVTIMGPGGVGKTRLALQVAWFMVNRGSKQPHFEDGVFFIPLSSINSAVGLNSAVAEALDFSFYRDVEPKRQLLNFLRGKKMLLVLDSFEHLIAEEVDFVVDLLVSSPAVKLLVTSREALKLQEEWLISIEGMRYPTRDDLVTDDLLGYSAIQLFIKNAQQVRPNFSIKHAADCILQICRLVEGMPLGLELAAAWLKVLPCAEIATQIRSSLDLLSTTIRNVPDRHRSIRAVFEHSWLLLSEELQSILLRLSVFQGDFNQTAAEEVAGASLLHLASLVEKSLLKVQEDGRYILHGLLRQFVAEKFEGNPQAHAKTQNKHHHFYMDLLQKQGSFLNGKLQKNALEALRQEIGNVQKAWQFAISETNLQTIAQGIDSLFQFYWLSSRYQEGSNTFQQAAEHLKGANVPDSMMIKLAARRGVFHAALGDYGLALELLQKSLSGARRLELQNETAFSLNALGNVIAVQGDNVEAAKLFQESLAISRQNGEDIGTAEALANLGWVTLRESDYPGAKRCFLEGLALYQAMGNQALTAHVLDNIGLLEFYMGEYEKAEGHFLESLASFRFLGDQYGMARAICGLGLVAWGVGGQRLPEARSSLEESVNLMRTIGQRLEVALQLTYLGAVANSQGDYQAATYHYSEGLTIAREIGFYAGVPRLLVGQGVANAGLGDVQSARSLIHEALEAAVLAHNLPPVFEALVSLAELNQQNGARLADAVAMATAITNHPACWQIFKDRASGLLIKLEAELKPASFAAAQKRGKTTSIEGLVVEIIT